MDFALIIRWRAVLGRSLLLLGLIFTSGYAQASQPSQHGYGPWKVTSIGSLSGDGTADSMVSLTQTHDENELSVLWLQGSSIVIAVHIEGCYGKDDDFEQSYAMPVEHGLAINKRMMGRRLKSDFSLWLEQAAIGCGKSSKLTLFRFDNLTSAASDFIDRVRYFSQFGTR